MKLFLITKKQRVLKVSFHYKQHMINRIIFIVTVFTCLSVLGQKDEILLTINEQPVYVSEFKRIYEKNIDQINEEDKDIDKNLDLFINYKLKLLEAYRLKLDTLKSYKSELRAYKNQLMAPYLQDNEFKAQLLKQAYERTLNEVRASHILVAYSKKNKSQDSTAVLVKINEALTKVKQGIPFEDVAKTISDDPSAKINGGDLGYFSAFRMVYQFEDAAYKTEVGDVSKPFKTRFGYHILKVTDKRKSRGDFEVAHVLVKDKSIGGKVKIDSVYQKLKNGISFNTLAEQYSEDKTSAAKGGRLPKFGAGRMVPFFEKEVLSLKKEGDYSAPFRTRYGWHIVKLIKNYPVKPFEEIKEELERKIRNSSRGNLSTKKLVSSLKQKYAVKEYKSVFEAVQESKEQLLTEDILNQTVLSISNKNIPLKSYLEFKQNKSYLKEDMLWNKFLDNEVLNYYKEDLVHIFPEYKHTLQEYKDGLLLFDLMKMKIWDQADKNAEGLEAFFEKNTSKYGTKELKDVRGEVISDYQKELENVWIDTLKANNKIKVRKSVLKKIKKVYRK